MKKQFVLIAGLAMAIVTLSSFMVEVLPSTPASPVFTWSEVEFDFGNIQMGTPVSHEFMFTNTGKTPLVISNVQTPCGCTVTEFSKDAVAPGAQGYVKATYNAAKVGKFNKVITVNANTDDGIVKLTIAGEVIEPYN